MITHMITHANASRYLHIIYIYISILKFQYVSVIQCPLETHRMESEFTPGTCLAGGSPVGSWLQELGHRPNSIASRYEFCRDKGPKLENHRKSAYPAFSP